MHQPIYYPYENINNTMNRTGYGYIKDVFNERTGPYTTWPKDAIQLGNKAGIAEGGAQVSFSGSLIEDIDNLAMGGFTYGGNWMNSYKEAASWKTSMGNPKLDMVAFGYFHPLMGLIDQDSIKMQIRLHKNIYKQTWDVPYSKGIFPPENAFSERMIPALVEEGLQWVLVDNIHFDRACQNYPWSNGTNLFPPNKADQINPDPIVWIGRTDMWAPGKMSPSFGYKPHYSKYINPGTGEVVKIIVVPTARYEGNEDGRGGFGALQYEKVLSQLLLYNNDPKHPILVVMAHDGDNYGGGSDGYYHSNFQNFVDWVKNNPNFKWTTVQDYLDKFPPDSNDIIHVEDGSWPGADNGDPQFSKWNGAEDANGYSYDRNSWAAITAAENIVKTANAIKPYTSIAAVQAGTGSETDIAWHYFLVGQTSCYWYWDGTKEWDSLPTLASNQATDHAVQIACKGTDVVGPSIYTLQRTPYNPGEYEWRNGPEPSDFTVWTFIYDFSEIKEALLKYRTHKTVINDGDCIYGQSAWNTMVMSGKDYPPPKTDPLPKFRAQKYSGTISLSENAYVDYYVEAEDGKGNISKTDIYHTWVTVRSKPVPPTNVMANADSSNKITVSWTAAHEATSYSVYISKIHDGTYSLAGTTKDVGYSVTGLDSATAYYFKVSSVNASGASDFSNVVSASTKQANKPVPPANVSAIADSSDKITVSWTAAHDASSYNVYISTMPEGMFNLANTTTGVTCSISGLISATTYYFKVVSVNSAGSSDFSNVVYAKTKNKESGTAITIHYKTIWDCVNIHYNNGISWTTIPGEKMSSEGNNWFKCVETRDISASILVFCFNQNGNNWDNNSGQNYKTSLTEVWIKAGVIYNHNPESGVGTNVTIHYKTNWNNVNFHYNNGNGWTIAPGILMENEGNGWFKDTVLRDASALILIFCFNINGSSWDNNNGQNYTTDLTEAWIKDHMIYGYNPEK